jgi:REP element-mobilizing transposase RayT
MNLDNYGYFITWTTYGTWLPGDSRGWRKNGYRPMEPQPLLEDWCRARMLQSPVILDSVHRSKIEAVCRDHAKRRSWNLIAMNARSNHVHVVVQAPNHSPQIVRDQLKANATRVLREPPEAIIQQKLWTRGGDCELIRTETDLEQIVAYVIEGQDSKI